MIRLRPLVIKGRRREERRRQRLAKLKLKAAKKKLHYVVPMAREEESKRRKEASESRKILCTGEAVFHIIDLHSIAAHLSRRRLIRSSKGMGRLMKEFARRRLIVGRREGNSRDGGPRLQRRRRLMMLLSRNQQIGPVRKRREMAGNRRTRAKIPMRIENVEAIGVDGVRSFDGDALWLLRRARFPFNRSTLRVEHHAFFTVFACPVSSVHSFDR